MARSPSRYLMIVGVSAMAEPGHDGGAPPCHQIPFGQLDASTVVGPGGDLRVDISSFRARSYVLDDSSASSAAVLRR